MMTSVVRFACYKLPSGLMVAPIDLAQDDAVECIYVTNTGSIRRRLGSLTVTSKWLLRYAVPCPWVTLTDREE